MDRFSKENIDKLVLMPRKGAMARFRKLMGPTIDFSGLISGLFVIFITFAFSLSSQLLILSAILFSLQLFFFYYIFIKFYRIKINEYKIDIGLKKEVQFLFVSDLHVGKEYASTNTKRLNKIIQTINNQNQDLVLLGGDFLTHDIEPELLEQLKNIKGRVYAVYGNHDAEYLEDKVEYNIPTEFINAFSKSNIQLLINNNTIQTISGTKLNIAGIPDLYSKTFNIEKAFEGSAKDAINILLSHNPDVIDFISENDNIDLVLSGHNHSGQIFMPIIGAVLPMPTKRRWLTKGIFQVNKNTKLLLSQGIGHSGSRLRINTDAEICLVTLY